jgi:hypothetical protein
MQCYACDDQATRQCRRCARVYCELHGGDLCAECLSPASSLPSFNLYRGSLLALLVGTAVALWLIVRPPGSGSGNEVIISQVTPTAIVSQGTRTPAGASPTSATLTAVSPVTETPQPTATVGPREYFVQSGDTLIGIATQFAPPGVDPFIYAQQIAAASGLSSVNEPITTGERLALP